MGKSESKTINYYDGIAKGYKNLYHEEQIKKISLITQFLPKSGNLLDLGSGDGVLNQFLNNNATNINNSNTKNNKNKNNLKIISLDISLELLKLNSNQNKIQASALSIPIKKSKIDFICSFSVFQDLPNIEKAIIETKRILKPQGIGIISFLKLSSNYKLLSNLITQNFQIIKTIENEEKDIIFIFENNK